MLDPVRILLGSGQLWPLRLAGSRKQSGSDLVLDGPVRLWPNGSVPEASRCARIFRPGSGQTLLGRFGGRIRAGSSMFTGYITWHPHSTTPVDAHNTYTHAPVQPRTITVTSYFCLATSFISISSASLEKTNTDQPMNAVNELMKLNSEACDSVRRTWQYVTILIKVFLIIKNKDFKKKEEEKGRTQAPNTRVYWLYNLHNLKLAANRDLRRMKTAARKGKGGS